MTTAVYSHPACSRHEMGAWHPEAPARLQAIEDQLIASRIDAYLVRREAPAVDLADVRRVHSDSAIALVRDHLPAAGDYYPLDGDTLLKNDLSLRDIERLEDKTTDDDTVSIVVSIGGLAVVTGRRVDAGG